MTKAIALVRHYAPTAPQAAYATARSALVIGCAAALALAGQALPLIQAL